MTQGQKQGAQFSIHLLASKDIGPRLADEKWKQDMLEVTKWGAMTQDVPIIQSTAEANRGGVKMEQFLSSLREWTARGVKGGLQVRVR